MSASFTPEAFDVDFNKRAEFDAADMDTNGINLNIRRLMGEGYGTIVIKNPGAKHSLGVGILNPVAALFRRQPGLFRRRANRRSQCASVGTRGLVLRREHDGGHRHYRKERRVNVWRCNPGGRFSL